MKKLVLFTFLLCLLAVTAPASTVNFWMTNFVAGGGATTNGLKISPVGPPVVNGIFMQVGRPIWLYPSVTTGNASTNLQTGIYQLEIYGFIFQRPIYFVVPNDANTYNATSLITNGVTTLPLVAPFVSQILAGSGVTVSPPGGQGIVTITATGGGGGGGDVFLAGNNAMTGSNIFFFIVGVSNLNSAAGIRLGTNGNIDMSGTLNAHDVNAGGARITSGGIFISSSTGGFIMGDDAVSGLYPGGIEKINVVRNDTGINLDFTTGEMTDVLANKQIAQFSTRNLTDSSGTLALDWDQRQVYDSSGPLSIDWQNRQLSTGTGETGVSIDWGTRNLMDASGGASVNWGSRQLDDDSSTPSVDWTLRRLFTGSGTLILDWSTTTVSVNGTLSATTFSGSGASLTSLNAGNISSGTLSATRLPAFSGDITTSAGSSVTALKSTGTAGTYRSVTFDAQGRETSGSNPTTFSGYAISDTSANLAAALTDETGSGAAVFASGATMSSLTLNQSNYAGYFVANGYSTPTNLVVAGTVNLTNGLQILVTNASFTWGQPINPDAAGKTYQPPTVIVSNSAASAITMTLPTGWTYGLGSTNGVVAGGVTAMTWSRVPTIISNVTSVQWR